MAVGGMAVGVMVFGGTITKTAMDAAIGATATGTAFGAGVGR
jgi:hypothetical protein